MAKFEYSPPDVNYDLAYLLVDDTFDLHALRTEEGLTIDIYQYEGELLSTLAVENPEQAEA